MIQTAFEWHVDDECAARAAGRASYHRALAAVLGDGANWEYRGECLDNGRPVSKCSCGHPGIRHEFLLRHKGGQRTAIVGSTCINHWQGISQELADRIQADADRLQREADERLKAAKRLVQEKTVAAKLDELHRLAWELDERLAALCKTWEFRNRSRSLKYAAWLRYRGAEYRLLARDGRADHPCIRMPKYKQHAAAVKWLDRQIADHRAAVTDPYQD